MLYSLNHARTMDPLEPQPETAASPLEAQHALDHHAHRRRFRTGYTRGALEGDSAGGSDAFVRSSGNDGTLRWTRQFGTSFNDIAFGVATDANGGVYLTGETFGALEGASAGGFDAFVRKHGR